MPLAQQPLLDLLSRQRDVIGADLGHLVLTHATRTKTDPLAVHTHPVTTLGLFEGDIIVVFEAKAAVLLVTDIVELVLVDLPLLLVPIDLLHHQ